MTGSVRAAGWGLTLVPAATLTIAYAWMAVDHRTAWLWDVVVHESGRYTLGETVAYGRHLVRELPIVLTYAAASTSAAACWGPGRTTTPSTGRRALALVAAAVVVASAWASTTATWGGDVAWREALQTYRRDDDVGPVGVHWTYHLLSTFVYLAAAVGLAALLRRWVDGTFGAPRRNATAPLVVAALVVVVTAATLRDASPFVDARYLGHQAREVLTHLVVTLPLSFAALAWVGRWRIEAPTRQGGSRTTIAIALAGLGVLAYLVLGAAVTGASRVAQPAATSSLVGAHCFEHALDYVVVVLLTIAWAPGRTIVEAR